MKASMVDLRYKTKEIMKALEAHEEVLLTFRGKVKAKIVPVTEKAVKKKRVRAEDLPTFGMRKGDKRPIAKVMGDLRGGRHRDL